MINKATREFQQKALAGLSPEQVQALFHGLNVMRENLTLLGKDVAEPQELIEVNQK
jgi:hypothetical protein